MSASDKKKLRKEQSSAFLSEKQRQEQSEAKKLKIYTIVFVAAMILVACIALVTLCVRFVTQSGILEKNTIAAKIGDTELNTVELAYYYNDAINEMYRQVSETYNSAYSDIYFDSMGLDISKSLSEQTNPTTGDTWANYFVDAALESAQSDFAMYNLAVKNGFKLSEDEQSELDSTLESISSAALLYGYGDADDYLEVVYGYGADMESYSKYLERTAIADAYYAAHYEDLSYDDAAIREHEAEHYNNYNSYTYAYSYLSYTDFREGGTTDEETGSKTYTEEENAAAREKLKTAAEKLATATSLEELKTMVAETEVNESSQLAVNEETNRLHTAINAPLNDWLAAEERKEGEIAAVANVTTTEASEDTESTEEQVVNGYYVVVFQSRTDNAEPMSNVRHLLVEFEGGTTDEETGETVYSEEEKGVAKTEAESLLKQWQEGEATEDSFIELVKEYSDDTSAEDGGLFEDIHPDSNYVPEFLNWAISADRKPGDAQVIETEFGYHVMYYVGDDEMTYRDYMISEELKTAAQDEWYNAAVEATTVTKKNLSRLNLDLVIAGGL